MADSPFQRRPKPEISDEEEFLNPAIKTPPPSPRRAPIQGCGCWILIAVWIIILLVFPCAFVTLLVEKELIFSLGDLPDEELRIFLLNDQESRGIGVQRPDMYSEEEGQYCILIITDYFLWDGDADGLTHCNCYEKIEEEWVSTMVGGDENCDPIQSNSPE